MFSLNQFHHNHQFTRLHSSPPLTRKRSKHRERVYSFSYSVSAYNIQVGQKCTKQRILFTKRWHTKLQTCTRSVRTDICSKPPRTHSRQLTYSIHIMHTSHPHKFQVMDIRTALASPSSCLFYLACLAMKMAPWAPR